MSYGEYMSYGEHIRRGEDLVSRPSTPPRPTYNELLNDTIINANVGNLDQVRINLDTLPKEWWFTQNSFGETILIRLADKGDVELVNRLLLNASVSVDDVNKRNINGNSAIILTGRSSVTLNTNTKKIIDALIEKGANITDNNYANETALSLANKPPTNSELSNYIKTKIDAKYQVTGGKLPAKKPPKRTLTTRKTKITKSKNPKKSRRRRINLGGPKCDKPR